jgi:hypothetical protein
MWEVSPRGELLSPAESLLYRIIDLFHPSSKKFESSEGGNGRAKSSEGSSAG